MWGDKLALIKLNFSENKKRGTGPLNRFLLARMSALDKS